RSAASWSRSRVTRFSLARCCLRSISHSSRDTMRGRSIALSFGLHSQLEVFGLTRALAEQHGRDDRAETARRSGARYRERRGRQTRWAHGPSSFVLRTSGPTRLRQQAIDLFADVRGLGRGVGERDRAVELRARFLVAPELQEQRALGAVEVEVTRE